jgi:MSHA biogenesis protein MshN
VQSSATLAAAEPDGPRPSEVPEIPVSRDAAATDGPRKSGLKLATAIDVPASKNVGDSPWLAKPGSLPKKARPAPAQPPSIQKQARASTAQERADADYRHAVALMNEGRVTDSQEMLRGALREDPAHAQARLMLVGMLVEQKRLDEAQVVLQQGLDRDPAQPAFAMRLARIQVERGDSTAAAGTLLRAAPAATGNAEFRGFHAAVLQRLARHKEAVLEYQAALRLSPQSGVWWMGLGISLEADGRPAEARDAFLRARATRTLSPELDRFVDQKLRQLH